MSVPKGDRPYEIVVFGASGFTGQYVVEYVAKAVAKQGDGLKWAVAGRSESKLKDVLKAASDSTGVEGLEKNIPLVICDVSDQESLNQMAKTTKLVLNCVGPYRFYGEAVVKACVENGAHHIDISGEPQFLETMQLKYSEQAEANGVFVVGSCGFDSIPSDLGGVAVHKAMEGPVNKIETYLKVTAPPDAKGALINFGTWQSAIYGFAMAHELKDLRKKLFPDRLPQLKPRLTSRGVLHKSQEVGDWCFTFPGADRTVMMRTERFRLGKETKRPAQIQCYAQVSSLFYALMIAFFGIIFGILAKFSFGRTLLEKFPGVFSAGAVSKQGPSREVAENTNFTLTLIGFGWSGKSDEDLTDLGPETRKVRVTVSGKNIGYGSTCECMVQAALVILQESNRLPGRGGVLTPGFAFANTSLIDRLNSHQVPFKVEVEDMTSN